MLVPLYDFYPSIESFLDTAVKRTIEQAADNPSLEPFDIKLLQVLFLIRYVDEMKGNVDNLVTLCIDEIDADRLALRRQIEESLQRLEKETLINRSGDNYSSSPTKSGTSTGRSRMSILPAAKRPNLWANSFSRMSSREPKAPFPGTRWTSPSTGSATVFQWARS